MGDDINAAILERLEKVVSTLQDNSVKMGQLLAVHNEKLDKQDRIDAVLTIFGALSVISFIVSPVGQRIIRPVFEPSQQNLTIPAERPMIGTTQIM